MIFALVRGLQRSGTESGVQGRERKRKIERFKEFAHEMGRLKCRESAGWRPVRVAVLRLSSPGSRLDTQAGFLHCNLEDSFFGKLLSLSLRPSAD